MIIGIIIGMIVGVITSRLIAYRNVKKIGQEFRTVAKRREYRENTFKKKRATHNRIGEQFNSEEQPPTKKRKNSGKRKYYKRKNNTNRNKKAVKS